MKKSSKFIVGILLVLFFKTEIEVLILKSHGNIAHGVVTKIYKVGSKGTIMMNYYFEIDHIVFQSEGYLNPFEETKVGDTIDIVYFIKYPSISRNKRYLDNRW